MRQHRDCCTEGMMSTRENTATRQLSRNPYKYCINQILKSVCCFQYSRQTKIPDFKLHLETSLSADSTRYWLQQHLHNPTSKDPRTTLTAKLPTSDLESKNAAAHFFFISFFSSQEVIHQADVTHTKMPSTQIYQTRMLNTNKNPSFLLFSVFTAV